MHGIDWWMALLVCVSVALAGLDSPYIAQAASLKINFSLVTFCDLWRLWDSILSVVVCLSDIVSKVVVAQSVVRKYVVHVYVEIVNSACNVHTLHLHVQALCTYTRIWVSFPQTTYMYTWHDVYAWAMPAIGWMVPPSPPPPLPPPPPPVLGLAVKDTDPLNFRVD